MYDADPYNWGISEIMIRLMIDEQAFSFTTMFIDEMINIQESMQRIE